MSMILYVVILAIIFLGCFISFLVLNSNASDVRNIKVIAYVLLFGLFISAFGFLGMVSSLGVSFIYFILFQLVFLGLGYLVFFLLKRDFWGAFEKEKLNKVLFVISNATAGMIGFTLLFDHFNNSGVAVYYSMSVLTFLMPQFISTAYKEFASIPEEIYKIWYYPVGGDEIDFENIDTNNIYMLELEYSKSIDNTSLTNTKLRAPLEMNFGDWFRAFIDNYNNKFDEDPIIFMNNDNTPHGWIFYLKPSFTGAARYIDPDLTITGNKLNEKNVIIARRVGRV